jgi:hypothetical protein
MSFDALSPSIGTISILLACGIVTAGCTADEAADETVTGAQVARLDACANGAAPADLVTVDELLEAMADDLRTFDAPDRAGVRYITLGHVRNGGASPACLERYRAAMNLALNSVSSGQRTVTAVPIDDTSTVYRIELADYGWDAARWQQLVAGYPYNVRYDVDSALFPFRGDLSDELRADTESPVPYVYGDWLAAAVTAPSLYHGLLALPDTLAALEDRLGIDTIEATANERVDRAGVVRSEVSTASRVIARYALPGNGALWTSCDLAAGQDLFADAVDPICARREVVFTLPNGLPAYYSADRSGNRIDGAAAAGLACGGCHAGTGVIARNDEVRAHVLEQGADDLDTLLALYPTRDEMSQRFARDQAGFAQARRAAGARDAVVEPVTWVSAGYGRTLGLAEAAATLGIEPESFEDALAFGGAAVPAAAHGLLRSDGRIGREAWNEIYGDVVSAIGLAEPCDVDDVDCF